MGMFQEQSLYDDAIAALAKGMRDLARSRFEDVVSINPKSSLAYAQIAAMQFDEGRHHDCIVNYERAIACDPQAQFFNNLGSALIERSRWEDAEASYREAIARDPRMAMAYNNLGRLLLIRGRPSPAKDAFQQAIMIHPNYPEAHVSLAFTHLELGEFEDGWAEYEWRRKQIPQNRRLPPDFVGQRLNADDAIILIGEQGLGDVIQFCRYAPLIKQRYGCRVYIEVNPLLIGLIGTLDGIDGVVRYGYPFPGDVKYSLMLMSCPLLFGHYSEGNFPKSQSYLRAEPSRSKLFLPYFKDMPAGPRIGMCWAGGGGIPSADKRRSTNLSTWAPLGEVEDVSWVSLQKGDPAKQLKAARTGMTILNVIDDCADMADTAALIMHCDLVITVDTAIAHLSAALGKPTWVLSRRDACWRWLGDRRDSPWYPTVRHYRQKKFGDWDGLMTEVAGDLREYVK